MATADELYLEAKCFLCYGMTQAQALKLALLRRKALELDPDADVTPETLLLNASCYNCYANGSIYDLLELALLAIIADTPCTGTGDGLIWGPNSTSLQFFNFDAGSFDISGSITSITFPTLTTITTDFTHQASATTLSIEAPMLVSIGGFINIQSNSVLTTLDLTSLMTVGGNFQADSCVSLPSFLLPSLQTVGGNFDCVSNSPVPTIDVSSLISTGGWFSGGGNTAITSLSCPALTTVGAEMVWPGCTLLASFSAPLWVPTDGTQITFNGDALNATSVELILRRCVLAGVLTCIIDLSGGTNAGTASLSAQGQADVVTLGAQVTMNP